MAKPLSLLATIVLSACVITLALRREILGTGPVTLTVQALAILLMVWARLTFGVRSFHATANATQGGLVTTGPYRYLRHPIYAAVFYFTWSAFIAHANVVSFALVMLASAMSIVRMRLEESEL